MSGAGRRIEKGGGRRGWACGLLLVLIGGCAYRPMVPGEDRPAPAAHWSQQETASGGVHVVRPGETLYSIAWEAGFDYRDVAAWNGITPPYLIKPGQEIRLSPPAAARRGAGPPGDAEHRGTAAAVHTVARGETLYGIARRYGLAVRELAAWNGIAPPYTVYPGQRLRLHAPDVGARSGGGGGGLTDGKPSTEGRSTAPLSSPRERLEWIWPTEGTLLARFDPRNGNNGIDIGGRPGQAILAAAPGTVVYQGSGLRGYGQLIIIKHDADYLSAYAHNAKIYVQEGDVVKRGQKIAEMGSTGTDRVKLHFEIRARGVPVDPLDHLPKR